MEAVQTESIDKPAASPEVDTGRQSGEAAATMFDHDCITGMHETLPAESVHLIVTSIPFEELFSYSGKLQDVGNNGSTVDIREGRFALNMRFVVEGMLRVLAPGCNACIHIQQLLAYKNQHGFQGRRDFRGAMIDVFSAGGFRWTGEFAIQKNPQAMANRLNLHSLQFKTGYGRDARSLAPCPNDYVLIFQKPGEPPAPPVRPLEHRSNPGAWLSTDDWVRDAHGIWTDIPEIDVLDGWRSARASTEEKHVCPLQLTVIGRLVELYSNPVDVQPDVCVLDPFMGIGSTAYVCLGGLKKQADGELAAVPYVHAPRNVAGFELKESYFSQCLRNIEKARQMRAEMQTGGVCDPVLPFGEE